MCYRLEKEGLSECASALLELRKFAFFYIPTSKMERFPEMCLRLGRSPTLTQAFRILVPIKTWSAKPIAKVVVKLEDHRLMPYCVQVLGHV